MEEIVNATDFNLNLETFYGAVKKGNECNDKTRDNVHDDGGDATGHPDGGEPQ